jgi:hypothetical protein
MTDFVIQAGDGYIIVRDADGMPVRVDFAPLNSLLQQLQPLLKHHSVHAVMLLCARIIEGTSGDEEDLDYRLDLVCDMAGGLFEGRKT